jgi:hypothetical protein
MSNKPWVRDHRGDGGSEEGGDGEDKAAPARCAHAARCVPLARAKCAGGPDLAAAYAVLYSIDDHATWEYFPLELGDADYAARILRTAGRIVEPQGIDNRGLTTNASLLTSCLSRSHWCTRSSSKLKSTP